MFNKADFSADELAKFQSLLNDFQTDKSKLNETVAKFFGRFDEDNNGFLDKKELRHFMESFFKEFHVQVPLNDDFVFATFNQMDANHDNKIQIEELQNFAASFVGDLLKQYQ